MPRFAYHADTGMFAIDPAHLGAGLAAARRAGHAAVRVMAMDHRSDRLEFDPTAFAGQRWIRSLVLDEELRPDPAVIGAIYALGGLVELTMPAWIDLDLARFPRLTTLVLAGASRLDGIDALERLEMLYLIRWQAEELPPAIRRLHAPEVRIGGSRRLGSIDRLLVCPNLRDLTLQDLPRLGTPARPSRLDGLRRLHLEGLPWRDLGWLRSRTLADLEIFQSFAGLAFIAGLPALERLYVWECLDGDLSPALVHPRLREVYLDRDRRRYSHRERDIQAALSARLAGRRPVSAPA